MIAVAPPNTAAVMNIVESAKVALDFVWPWTQVTQTTPPLIVGSPLNAIFDEGISWEDAEWQ